MSRFSKDQRLEKIGRLCAENARSLLLAIGFCREHGIGGFRVLSPILPLKTHPQFGYAIEDLPTRDQVVDSFDLAASMARNGGVRLTFHPDQFVVLNSRRPEVVENSIRELNSQTEIAELVGADVLTIHAGEAYDDKNSSLERLRSGLNRLPDRVRSRLTLENDDHVYSPEDLLPLCRMEGVPLVYDVHHHRLNQDSLSVLEATEAAIRTWSRTPVFHLSSPREGWEGPRPERHHDFIDPHDFPSEWKNQDLLIEVEAKAKERAVLSLKAFLEGFS